MLDIEIIEQLKVHFAGLESSLAFAISPSPHPKQSELRSLLESLAGTSPKLTVVDHGAEVKDVRFELLKNGAPTGVRFRGVPGGHEFTSLVLAILNSDGKGRLPDAAIVTRIRALRGPIDVRTYVSLSCTNCPDVVQALNVMAILHGDFRHEMVDGEIAEGEVQRLGIQGVPAVVINDKIVHVGKATLAELLEAFEERLGTVTAEERGVSEASERAFDVVVIGGGPAGVAAAIYSARKGLSTAILAQRFGGQVQDTLGIENLISVPHTEGPKLAADLVQHLRAYPIELLEHRKVAKVDASGIRKVVHVAGGERFSADAVIVATGAKWRKLGIPGEEEYIGRGVAFCPHCDGPFYKGKRVAVIGGGNSGVEAAIDLAGICSHVTLVEFMERLKADEVLVNALTALPNVTIMTNTRCTEVIGDGGKVTALRLTDRASELNQEIDLEGVFVQVGLIPNSAFLQDVVDMNRFGEITIDSKNRTSVEGIYAAGDVTTVPFKQIVIAMGEGAKAALSAFEDRIHR